MFIPLSRMRSFMVLFTVLLLSLSSTASAIPGKLLVIKEKVSAAAGGVFTDNPTNPAIEISIPAGALENDSILKVVKVKPLNPILAKKIGEAQSPAFKISLLTKVIKNGHVVLVPVTILEPIKIAITANPLPVHPQIGELARHTGGWKGSWQRMMTNFYHPSTGMVASLTKQAVIKLKVRHRTLQAASGPAVERGKDNYFNKTWGAELMWTDRYHLDQLLNSPILTPFAAAGLGVQIDGTVEAIQPIAEFLTSSPPPTDPPRTPAEQTQAEFDLAVLKAEALNNPAITIALLQADAVIGVRAQFTGDDPNVVTRAALTCALCHVAVTKTTVLLPQFDANGVPIANAPLVPTPLPFGAPILGPPNVAMNAGAILSLTPFITELQSLTATTPLEHNHSQSASNVELDDDGNPIIVNGSSIPLEPFITIDSLNGVAPSEILAQLQSWGPGRLDPRFFIGNPVNDNVGNPSSIPPHWNYTDLGEQGYSVPWIGVTVMRPDNHSLASGPECGVDLVLGTNGAWGVQVPVTVDPITNLPVTATITDIEIGNPLPANFLSDIIQAEIDEPGNVVLEADILDIEAFLKSIVSPAPGEFDEALAENGWKLFYGKANCVACHSTPEGTGPGYFTNITANPPQGLLANGIKVPGLRGLVHTAPYFHDGSAVTLFDVMKRYTSDDIPQVPNDLTDVELTALAEYMKTL